MKNFPIMVRGGTKGPCPSSIPWDMIAPYEGMAIENHQQSLEKLASRGGLCPVEAFFVMTGRTWNNVQTPVSDELEREACAFIDKTVRDRSELQLENARLKEAVKKIVVFNLHDVRRPMLTYDENAVQVIWEILGFPNNRENKP
jgi:hypothetical protein